MRRGRAGRELSILFAKQVSQEVPATRLNCNVRAGARWHRRERSVRGVYNRRSVSEHLSSRRVAIALHVAMLNRTAPFSGKEPANRADEWRVPVADGCGKTGRRRHRPRPANRLESIEDHYRPQTSVQPALLMLRWLPAGPPRISCIGYIGADRWVRNRPGQLPLCDVDAEIAIGRMFLLRRRPKPAS